MRHIFLTGDKRVGKSTVLKRLLEGETRVVGGFRTVKTDQLFDRPSIHLLPYGSAEALSEENRLFFYREAEEGQIAARFDRLGLAALRACPDAELIVMDELGFHESGALRFQAAVMHALDGDVPVIGVLQKAKSPFLSAVQAHPKVELVTVTEENRDALPSQLKRR